MATSPLAYAQRMIGSREGQAALTDFLSTGGQNLDPVTTAWCAAFVNATLGHAGMSGSGSNMARSFLNYGSPVTTPQAGDIAVFSRGRGPQGHVGFYEGMTPGGQIEVLGGNQGNAVSLAAFDPSRLLGYRRPTAQGGTPPQTAQAEPQASQSGQAPGMMPPAPMPPPQQQPLPNRYMQAILGDGGNSDWLQNRSYSFDALAADYFAGHSPMRRFIYQKLFM